MERTFQLLPYASLSQAALDSIRNAIFGGKLRPGDRILESQVAAELGISRAPIREAIRQLVSEGLLQSYPHRGTFVAQFSAQDVSEIYSLRAALEGLAARLVAQRPEEKTLGALEACVDTMHARAQAGDIPGMIESDVRFHEILCQATQHQRLIQVWMSMSTQIRAFVSISNRLYLTPEDLVARHRAVLEAIQQRQVEQACQLLTHDIIEVGQYVGTQLSAELKKPSPREDQDHD